MIFKSAFKTLHERWKGNLKEKDIDQGRCSQKGDYHKITESQTDLGGKEP